MKKEYPNRPGRKILKRTDFQGGTGILWDIYTRLEKYGRVEVYYSRHPDKNGNTTMVKFFDPNRRFTTIEGKTIASTLYQVEETISNEIFRMCELIERRSK